MRSSRNNILAGLFVLVAIAVGFAIALTLGKAGEWAVPRNDYVVEFSLADGAVGLRQGSSVKIGGQPVGMVRTVEIQRDAAGVAQSVHVVVAIEKANTLYQNASVYLELPLLGTVSSINIPNVGSPDAQVLAPGSVIRGTLSPPAFLAQAGYGEIQKTQMQTILENGSKIADDLKVISKELRERVGSAGDSVAEILKRVQDLLDSAKQWIAQWGPKFDSLLDKANAVGTNVNDGVTDARRLIATAQDAVDQNRARIESIIRNADEAMQKLNTQVVAEIERVIKEAERGVAAFRETGEKLDALVAEQTPELRLTLANLRLASDQLKLTMTEVRRNPWRALYNPGRKELEKELLYDAARSFAQAASDLNAASASLDGALEAAKASGRPIDQQQLQDITTRMNETLQRYRQAEDEFRRRLLEGP